jgi:L-iditol 2-dehydrogenase
MQVVAIDSAGEPGLEERPEPVPGRGEVLLRLRWSGLCGTDLFKLATGSAPAGSVLGHEVVGEVIAAGDDITQFAPGDRVVVPHHVACGDCVDCRNGAETQCAMFRDNLLEPGGFAERILVRPRAVATALRRLPDSLDDLDALFLEPGACVLRSLRKASIPLPGLPPPGSAAAARSSDSAGSPGSSTAGGGSRRVAAIFGGGSMGLLHLLVLRALGAEAGIVVVDRREDRRRLALELGADEALAPGEPLLACLRTRSADGRGADAVFDCVGGSELAAAALAALRPGGTLVLFAHGRAGESAGFELNDLFKLEKRLVGAYSGSLAEQSAIFGLLCSGALRPARLVTHRLPLAQFAAGLELARRQEALKVAFHP